MKRKIPDNVWAIADSNGDLASLRVPIGEKWMNLPLVLTSRANARLVMKTYPQLSPRNTIRKMKNNMVSQ